MSGFECINKVICIHTHNTHTHKHTHLFSIKSNNTINQYPDFGLPKVAF